MGLIQRYSIGRFGLSGWFGLLFTGAFLLAGPDVRAQDLVLFGPADAIAADASKLKSALRRAEDGPGPGAELRSLTTLPFPSSTFLWTGAGGHVRLCSGAQVEQSHILETIRKGRGHMDYLEDAEALAAFRTAEALLPCSNEVLDSATLWQLFFYAAVLAADIDEAESTRLFRAAALADPAGTFDETYGPKVQRLYLKGREAAAIAAQVPLRLFDAGTVRTLYVDGKQVDPSEGFLTISADHHLVQARSSYGQFLSLLIEVRGDEDLVLATAAGLPLLLLDSAAFPESGGARASRLLLDEGGVGAGDEQLWMADLRDQGLLWRGRADGLWTRIAALGLARDESTGRARVPVAGLITGGVMLDPTSPRPGRVQAGLTAAVFLRPWRGLEVDVGLQSGVYRADDNFVRWLPLLRLGAHWAFDKGRFTPWVGAAFTISFHDSEPPGPGVSALGGLRYRLAGPLHLAAELTLGYNRGFLASLGVGLVLGL